MKDIASIYTDGACSGNPGPGGWAVIWFNREGKVSQLSDYDVDTTNNRMELIAMQYALLAAITMVKNDGYDEVKIYTDSSYVYNSISQNWIYEWEKNGWKNKSGAKIKNSDIWLSIISIIRRINALKYDINIYKVKGHADNVGNIRADELAVKMRDKAIASRTSYDTNFKPPKSYRSGRGYKSTPTYRKRKDF